MSNIKLFAITNKGSNYLDRERNKKLMIVKQLLHAISYGAVFLGPGGVRMTKSLAELSILGVLEQSGPKSLTDIEEKMRTLTAFADSATKRAVDSLVDKGYIE